MDSAKPSQSPVKGLRMYVKEFAKEAPVAEVTLDVPVQKALEWGLLTRGRLSSALALYVTTQPASNSIVLCLRDPPKANEASVPKMRVIGLIMTPPPEPVLSQKEFEVFRAALIDASAALRNGNSAKMLELLPPEDGAMMERQFKGYAELNLTLDRLFKAAEKKKVRLPSPFDVPAEDPFAAITSKSEFEIDRMGVNVWVNATSCFQFKKAGRYWTPGIDEANVGPVMRFFKVRGQIAEELTAGLKSGEVMARNVNAKVEELMVKYNAKGTK